MESGHDRRREEITPLISATSPINRDGNQRTSQSADMVKVAPPTAPNQIAVMNDDSHLQEPVFEGLPESCDINPAEPVEDRGKKSTKITFHQKITFFSTALATFANVMSFSIMSAFFPLEASARGMSPTVIGLVFSMFSFSTAIASPIFGKFLPVIGARFLFLAGSFISGGSNVLFGFLVDMPTETTFTAFCFILRMVEGFGTGASFTASSAIMANSFPDDVGFAVSLIEMMAGVGFSIGPAIGGLLYTAGGFKLPFLVLGGIDLLVVGISVFLMPQQGESNAKMGSVKEVLCIPAIWLALFVSFLGSSALGFIDPTLSLHLQKLDFTLIEITLMFLLFGGIYAIFSVIWGHAADKKKITRIMVTLGAFGCAVFFLLLGPSPLLKLPPQKFVAIIAIILGAVSISAIVMPTLVDMFISAEWYGLTQDLGLTSLLSGLWNSGFSIGTMLGPLLGGVLTDHLGFANAGTVMAGVYITTMLIICFFGVWEYRCGKGRRIPRRCPEVETNPQTDEERTPLISEGTIEA